MFLFWSFYSFIAKYEFNQRMKKKKTAYLCLDSFTALKKERPINVSSVFFFLAYKLNWSIGVIIEDHSNDFLKIT